MVLACRTPEYTIIRWERPKGHPDGFLPKKVHTCRILSRQNLEGQMGSQSEIASVLVGMGKTGSNIWLPQTESNTVSHPTPTATDAKETTRK